MSFIVVLSYLVMGFLTCWMRRYISCVTDFSVFMVAVVFWFWPCWFVWVLPAWLHEHVIGRKTS